MIKLNPALLASYRRASSQIIQKRTRVLIPRSNLTRIHPINARLFHSFSPRFQLYDKDGKVNNDEITPWLNDKHLEVITDLKHYEFTRKVYYNLANDKEIDFDEFERDLAGMISKGYTPSRYLGYLVNEYQTQVNDTAETKEKLNVLEKLRDFALNDEKLFAKSLAAGEAWNVEQIKADEKAHLEALEKMKKANDEKLNDKELKKDTIEELRKQNEKVESELHRETFEEIRASKEKPIDQLTPEERNKRIEDEIREKIRKAEEEPQNSGKRFIKDESDPNMKVYQVKVQPFEVLLFVIALTYIIYSSSSSEGSHEITFQEFKTKFLDKGFVEKLVVVNKSLVRIVLNDNGRQQNGGGDHYYYFSIGSIDNFEHKLAKAQDENNINPDFRIPVNYVQEGHLIRTIFQFLPTLLMIAGLFWITRRSTQGGAGGGAGGIFGVGKSKAKKFNIETDVKVKFKDVAGMAEAKEEVMEFVSFLKNPSKYEKLGGKIPRGAILSGPPGTGKTLLAKATAGEAGVAFYSVSGSEFVEMFVGVGASRVRDLFKTARENAPSIVFVDEIDAIGKARTKGNFSGANDERETTLNQLLVEMDGFQSSDHVVVLAGTNRPDVLDQALMRPGRFDRHIQIDKPELEGRKEIYQVYLKKILLDIPKDSEEFVELSGKLAALTPGFSGADISNVVNEAALIAARHNDEKVSFPRFEQAIERVIAGLEKKSKLLSPHEKKVVAYHEAGHAICGWYLEFADPLLKVSIIPRGQGALGYAQYLPPDIFLLSVDQLSDRMTMALGGRISEELHFPSVTSGASDDFKKVTNIAFNMVTRLGMSPKIGPLAYERKNDSDLTKPYSEETGTLVDEEVSRIINECAERCRNLLIEKADGVEKVAQLLLRKEVLTRNDMIELLGPRPFKEKNDAFDKYLDPKDLKKDQPSK